MSKPWRIQNLRPAHAFIILAGAVAVAVGLALLAHATGDRDNADFFERLTATLQAVGILSLAASFVAVAVQLQQSNRALTAQMFDHTAQRMAHLNELMLMAPEARGRLYGSAGSVVEQEVAILAEATVDYFDTELLRQAQFPDLLSDLPDFRPWMVQAFRAQSALRRHVEMNLDWYRDELLAVYLRALLPARFGADVDRLVFSREGLAADLRPGEWPTVDAAPLAVKGDLVVLRHGNDQASVGVVVGPLEATQVRCLGLTTVHSPDLPEGERLDDVVEWPTAEGPGAVRALEAAQSGADGWHVLGLEEARGWLDRVRKDVVVERALDERRAVAPHLATEAHMRARS